MKNLSAKKLVFMALFAAATTVATYSFRIPFAHGYFNLGEVMIYTAALTFGPLVGGFAGGLGAAIADIYAGYMIPWAPITFVVKGLEGYLVGRLGHGKKAAGRTLAVLIGGLAILIGYPVATGFLYGWPAALPELYMDLVQLVVGGAVAIPLSATLRGIFADEQF